MQSRIGVGTAHTLDESRHRIVVGIAFFIIRINFMAGYLFNGVVCDMTASRYHHTDLFQQVEANAGIAVSQAGQSPQHLIAGGNSQRTQALLFIRQGPPQDGCDSLFRQGIQLNDAQARQ